MKEEQAEYGLSVIGEHDSTDILLMLTVSEAAILKRIIRRINGASRSKHQPIMRLVYDPEFRNPFSKKEQQFIDEFNEANRPTERC